MGLSAISVSESGVNLKKTVLPVFLERFYGQLKSLSVNGTGNNGNSQSDPTEQNGNDGNRESDNSEHNGNMDRSIAVIAVLEDQVALLKSHLECEREEKVKLLDMLSMEQEKTKLLVLPQAEPVKKKENWLGYFRLKR